MAEIQLYIEASGEAVNKETAIANAALSKSSVPFNEGETVEVKIEAVWTDADGNYHAKVSLVQSTEPQLENIANDEAQVEVAADGITNPDNNQDTALSNTKKMARAEEALEDDFDGAVSDEVALKPKPKKKRQHERPLEDDSLELDNNEALEPTPGSTDST